jgi:dTMP kinase
LASPSKNLSDLSPFLKTHHGGFLLALEGVDGSGKSTQAGLATEALRSCGFRVSAFREPTSSTVWGRAIREAGPDPFVRRAPREELELFLKDRAWDVETNILPALEAGQAVVMDRYVLSSVAYQGALGIEPREILEASLAFPWPDMTIVLDLKPDDGLARIVSGRGATFGAFENAPYLRMVRDVLALAEVLPGVNFLDARPQEAELTAKIAVMIRDAVKNKVSGNSC